MLGKTSIYAVRSLLLLAQQDPGACWSPRRLAESLGESPTYLAKVMRHLVRGGILDAEKGVKGGVRMRHAPADITLLAIVEACQGPIAADYCRSERPALSYCAFHAAALELHEAITAVLGRWTLAELLAKPGPGGDPACATGCLIDPLMLVGQER
jgi:Rrf2 family protein